MGKFWTEESTYRVVVGVEGSDQVHEATLSDEHSAWPETSARCTCGFAYGPRTSGALAALREHFAELGVPDIKPLSSKTRHF
jgi:hypothetical protein